MNWNTRSDEAYEDEVHELRLQRQVRQRYLRELARHPDQRDPDYPEDEDEA